MSVSTEGAVAPNTKVGTLRQVHTIDHHRSPFDSPMVSYRGSVVFNTKGGTWSNTKGKPQAIDHCFTPSVSEHAPPSMSTTRVLHRRLTGQYTKGGPWSNRKGGNLRHVQILTNPFCIDHVPLFGCPMVYSPLLNLTTVPLCVKTTEPWR